MTRYCAIIWFLLLFSALPGLVVAQGAVTSGAKPALSVQYPVSFLNDVEPILTRAGCNQGACHGSQFGKGGYKLSLAGYDPDFDYDTTVRQLHGRRVAVVDPARSLFLTKPSLTVAHLGGLRLPRPSDDYRTLLRWIAAGAPGPDPANPQVKSLIVSPAQQTLLLINGDQVNTKITSPTGRAARLAAATPAKSDNEIIAELFQVTLARPPGTGERKLATDLLRQKTDKKQDRKAAIEDLLWTLINLKEFATVR